MSEFPCVVEVGYLNVCEFSMFCQMVREDGLTVDAIESYIVLCFCLINMNCTFFCIVKLNP